MNVLVNNISISQFRQCSGYFIAISIRISQEPPKAGISSGELLQWFNEQLFDYGEEQWNIMGRKWSSIKIILKFLVLHQRHH